MIRSIFDIWVDVFLILSSLVTISIITLNILLKSKISLKVYISSLTILHLLLLCCNCLARLVRHVSWYFSWKWDTMSIRRYLKRLTSIVSKLEFENSRLPNHLVFPNFRVYSCIISPATAPRWQKKALRSTNISCLSKHALSIVICLSTHAVSIVISPRIRTSEVMTSSRIRMYKVRKWPFHWWLCLYVCKKSQHINKRLHRDGVGQMIIFSSSLNRIAPTSPVQFVELK